MERDGNLSGRVWNAIREGADAYLDRQLRAILPWIGLLTLVMFLSVSVVPPSEETLRQFSNENYR